MSPTPPPNPASSQKPGSIEFYQDLLNSCKVNDSPELTQTINKIQINKSRYDLIASKCNVPWWVIAGLHYRECDLNFNQCLHNGDPLPGPTKNVPSGRGPFSSFEDAALDALAYDGLTHVSGWSLAVACQWAERFNGLGILLRHTEILTPYLWSGTNHYAGFGKYTSDGNFDPNARESQIGVVPIWIRLGAK